MPGLVRLGGLMRPRRPVSGDPVPVLSLRYGVSVTDSGGFASAWGVASAGVGERPAIVTTAGAQYIQGDGSNDWMTLPVVTVTEAVGWMLMLVYKPNTSQNADILGAVSPTPDTALTQRVQGDTNSVILYTSRGTRAPVITGQANNNARAYLARCNASRCDQYIGGGAGSKLGVAAGDFAIEALFRKGTGGGSFFNGGIYALELYNTIGTLEFANRRMVELTTPNSVPWSTAT